MLRDFIASFPRWEQYGIILPKKQPISIDWPDKSKATTQLALQFAGSDIIRTGAEPSWSADISGGHTVKRQANFYLWLIQGSSVNAIRADTNEFLFDFTAWLDEQNIQRKVPVFGDDPQEERTWATNGGFEAEWENPSASLYMVQLHKIYTVRHEGVWE